MRSIGIAGRDYKFHEQLGSISAAIHGNVERYDGCNDVAVVDARADRLPPA